MMVVGVLVAAPLALLSGPVPAMTPTLVLWMLGSGVGGVAGLLLVYRGLSMGKVGVVAALASTEGAIAAVLSVVAGEHMTIAVAVMLCVIAGGVATVALATGTAQPDEAGRGPGAASRPGSERQAVILGAIAAVCFGISIYSTAKVGSSMTPVAAVLPVRVVGAVGVFIPMLLSGRLRITRRAVPMVLFIGSAEVFGNAAYVVGAQESIAIAAVLASQFAAVAAIAAFVLFREHLSLHQRSGVVAIAVGVALLTLFRG
jgi:drug/metabolite transporter (DMT)-like permease